MTVSVLSDLTIERQPLGAWRSPSIVTSELSLVAPLIQDSERLVRPVAIEALRSRLRELANLSQGWDSYGAPPIDRFVLDAVEHLLERLPWEKIRTPQVVPTSRGGIALEWHRPGLEFSIEIEPSAESNAVALAFFADEGAGDTWEEDLLTVDQTRLQTALRRVASR